jgi:hypothetical protein
MSNHEFFTKFARALIYQNDRQNYTQRGVDSKKYEIEAPYMEDYKGQTHELIDYLIEAFAVHVDVEEIYVTTNSSTLKFDNKMAQWFENPTSDIPVEIIIKNCRGLLPKESKISSNPYCSVNYKGTTWVFPYQKDTLNPDFGYRLPMLISPDNAIITVSVWNFGLGLRASNNGRFLGQLQFNAKSLCDLASNPQKLRLEKRSKRSHVAGTMDLQVTRLDSPELGINEAKRRAFQILLSNPSDVFAEFMSVFFHTVKFKAAKRFSEIVEVARLYWMITDKFVAATKFDIVVKLFSTQLAEIHDVRNTLDELIVHFPTVSSAAALDYEKIKNSSEIAHHILLSLFSDFMRYLGRSEIGVPTSGKDLESIIYLVTKIEELGYTFSPKIDNTTSRFKSMLVTSTQKEFTSIFASAHDANEPSDFPLLYIVTTISNQLKILHEKYDILLFNSIHLPSLVAHSYYDFIRPLMEDFAIGYESDSHELFDVLELYTEVRELQKTSELIDYMLADKFPMAKWFKPFIQKWLLHSGFSF